jgi:hypothetical protein
MSLALGVGAAIFALLALQGFLAQYGESTPVWSWGVAGVVFLPPLAMAVLSNSAPTRVLKRLAGLCAVGHLVGLVTLVPALHDGKLAEDLGASWLLGVSVIATACAAVAWPAFATWPYVAACIVALGLDRHLASPRPIAGLAFQDALHTLLFDAIFTALALATRRAGRALDAAADAAIAETRTAAATAAHAQERARVEALLHDSVLVALLASTRGSPRAAAEARAALDDLDRLDRDDDETPPTATDRKSPLHAQTHHLVAVSIRGRMNALRGGRAAVVSKAGVGTRVSIGWREGA